MDVVEHRYPNPGFLGSSSHTTIFGHLSTPNDAANLESPVELHGISNSKAGHADRNLLRQGAQLLTEVVGAIDIEATKHLVTFWLAKETNLALGGLLVSSCVDALESILSDLSRSAARPEHVAKTLFANSHESLPTIPSSFSDYRKWFCAANPTWDTIGLALVAVGRATMDFPFFPPLFKDMQQVGNFRKLTTDFSDRCLELSLRLDCANDLQLIFQYESWILHSIVDGDQSK